MRFNDKELGAWASVFSPDKEGLLEKKGAGRGQGYKQRWFRLKGNLLFYFKVDELGGWEVVMQLLVSTAWPASLSVRTATDLGESWPFPVTVSS
ncbi:Sesquipedalian-1 [Geodia barretti]|uniref:Sesquipedalian-1 n=1 Tax=Geodia barretti TaxID=519541 RepID=A0AA35RY68_GEOBA|nr:Sesquipedalian-1 [Geodia barretti]